MELTSGAHGNSSLNNQRAGRGLMTPGEVKRLDRKKCLIFMEGQYPFMDWKNLPFNTAVWKESERLAGKEGYRHPVRVVYNPKTMTYRTILNKSKFQVIDKKDLEFYKEAEKTDKEMSGLEKEKYNSEVQLTEDSQFNENIVNVPNFGTQKEEWNLSGTIEQCIIRYASKLDGDQMKQYRREILNEK